ncbi:tetratricopeptide repeat protein [Tenacibaculum sp. 190130A14a]|uniref:tetratricopeptide repeat-containing sensor histidine kinase n=1 Tax=Tenacibaculum polynesiense TaxID=3137857 RepID=UPI0032B14F6B
MAIKKTGKEELLLLKKAVFFANQTKNDSIIYKTNVKLGVRSFYNGSIEHLLYSNENIHNLYLSNKDSLFLARKLHFNALEHRIKLNIDSAFYFYHKSKNISIKIKDSLAVGRRLLSIANIQREVKDFLGSEISSIEALKYLEPIKSYKYLVNVYNNLGFVSSELNNVKDAEKYYNKALDINKLNSDQTRKERANLFVLNNIGYLYQNQGEHKKAINYFKQGLAFKDIKNKYPVHYTLLLENLAASNFLLGNKENVLEQYIEVLNIRKSQKYLSDIGMTHINISDYYRDNKNVSKAIFHLNQSLKYSKQTQNNKKWLEALKKLSELTTGKKSKKYLEEYVELNDSLFQKERTQKNQFAKITYETEKKEKENVQLKIDNERQFTEIKYHKQQKTIGWLVAASVLLLFGFSISFFTFRRKRMLFESQLQKAAAREQERKQIAKSLHDEVAGDLRMLHQKLEKSQLFDEASKLNDVKENVRNLSHQLSSVSFKKVPFRDQIINLVSDYFSLDFRIKVNGLQEHDWTQVNSAIKRLLYLSVRESIQNCQKYAQANLITIDFSVHKKYVFLNITDNGIGFDTNMSKKGIGLRNIQERVEELSGTLTIDSEVGNGTKIHIQIPLNA